MSTDRVILVRLYEGEEILVSETNGSETLAKAEQVFTSCVDPDFKNWMTDHVSNATKAQAFAVFKMRKNAMFAEMFGSLNTSLDALCMTQSQIIRFCVEHRDKLRTGGYATFFLFKVNTEKGPEYFVARVYVVGGKLEAGVDRFGCGVVWFGDDRRRVVIPQL